jgi:ssDNA-binding Zn-finger/Zn-ribbon topoisomerase 1
MDNEKEQRCPKCGGKLVQRRRKYDGHNFLGCENFFKTGCKGAISTQRKYAGHRKEFELAVGRPVKKGHVLHHANGQEQDNRPENLIELTYRQHSQLHAFANKMHKEWGWNLEASTSAWLSARGKKGLIVVEDAAMEKYMETFRTKEK